MKKSIEQLENELTNEIAENGTDKMQELFLQIQAAKTEKLSKFVDRMEAKDPVIVGGIIGACIGLLISKND